MRYGTLIFALGALSSSQVSAQSVYVPRHVPPGPAYEPGYVPPGPVYRAPAFYGATRSVYPAQSAYVNRQSEYSSTYMTEFPLRPPASVPYVGGERCVTNRTYGPSVYCD